MKFHSCLWKIAYKIGGCPRVKILVMLLAAYRKWHNINKCRLHILYSVSSKVFNSTLGLHLNQSIGDADSDPDPGTGKLTKI